MSRRTARAARASTATRRSDRPAAFTLHAPAGISEPEARVLGRVVWTVAALLAVALLAVVLGPHRIGDYFTETDFYGAYADGARLIQHGRLDPTRYGVVGPGYEVALAAVGLVVRDLFLAAELISVAATVGTVLLWAWLLRRRADARVAAFAALFLAVNATVFRYGYAATTDALALALEAATLALLLGGTRSRAAAAAGVVAALAFLTRYTAGVLLPAGLVAILAGGTRFPVRGRGALLFLAGFVAPMLPWVLYSLSSGAPVSFQLHHNIAYEVFARAKGITWDDYQRTMQSQFHSLADVIARDPGAVAARMGSNVFDHLRRDAASLLGWPVALVAALGVAVGVGQAGFRRLWPLGLAGALVFLALVPAFYSERYSLALVPFYVLPAAWLFASPRLAFARRGAGDTRRWLRTALVVLPLGAALLVSVRQQTWLFGQLPVEALESASLLRSIARPGDRVMARKPHVAYHAGLAAEPFPFAPTIEELGARAHARGVRWLFMSWPEAETRPQFWYLLDTAGVVPGLTVRHATASHPSVLYEIGPAFGQRAAWMANDTLVAYHTARARLLVDSTEARSIATLAAIERARGNLVQSRALLERASRLRPNDVEVLVSLGKVALRQNDVAAGEAAFARARAVQPANVDAQVGLGWASLMGSRPEDAARRWRPVIEATRDPDTLERMAELYRSLGDREAAAAAEAALDRVRSGS